VVAASLAALESRRDEVNDLNVFPVADGDTGDNMAMTMRAVLDELDGLDGQPLDVIGREELVAAVARAALLGARGNSGVILSQIVRGAAEELASRPGELVDPVLVAAALARAVDAAYESVRDPAEGTMLSAVRAMAHRVAQEIAQLHTPRLEAGASAEEQDELLAELLERALDAATEAVERGPDQLPVLKEAGVVDAGAYGLTVIVAGVVAALRGHERTELVHRVPAGPAGRLPQHVSDSFRFCTNFAVSGAALDGQAHVGELEGVGDSVLVVGDDRTIRVHVHTDDPGAAVALFANVGDVSRLDVADMREQVAERNARLTSAMPQSETALCGLVVVASGEGMTTLFRALGALVVDGGHTMNPSIYEILAGIHAAAGEQVLVLPNSPNVRMTAESAAALSEKPGKVVPTRAQQEGLAALVAYDPGRTAAENAAAVEQAAATLRLGGVARAARADPQARYAEGDAVGYADGDLVAWGDPRQALTATMAAVAGGAELVTCIVGEGAPLDRAAVEAALPNGAELDYQDGGQPAWWWLLVGE